MIDVVVTETDIATADAPVRPTTEALDVATTRTAMLLAAAIASASARTDILDAIDVAIGNGIATVALPDAMPGETTMITDAETATPMTTDAEADEATDSNNSNTMTVLWAAAAIANAARHLPPRSGSRRLT